MLIEEDVINAPIIYINYLTKLQEVYTKTDTIVVDNFLKDIYTNAICEEDVCDIAKEYNLYVEFKNSDKVDLVIRGGYGYELNDIVFYFSRKGLENFLSNDLTFYNKAVFDMKRFLTHEDTHKQQGSRSKNKAFKNYIKLPVLYSKNPEENIKYFNQQVEADAYARQVGFQLKQKFPDKTASEIFEAIKQKSVRSEILGVYSNKDNEISEKNRRAFWSALWQYLDNQEDD